MDPTANPPYSLHKGSGQAKVRIAGKDIYLGLHGTPESYAKYAQVVAERRAGREPGSARHPTRRPSMTVGHLRDEYWRRHVVVHFRKAGKATSEQAVIRAALAPLIELYGDEPAAIFGPLQLKAVREHLIARGTSRRTINCYLSRVRALFKWGVGEEFVPPERLVALQAVAGLAAGRTAAREKPRVRAVDVEIVEATLPHCSARVAAMVRLQLLTGMRPGEVCRLTPGAIDRADPSAWVYRPAGHKTEHHDRDRVVVIGPRAQALLAPWLLRPGDSFCFQPVEQAAEAEGRTPAAVAAGGARRPGVGRPFTAGAYRHAVAKACRRAFPPPANLDAAGARDWNKDHAWHPNRLRHSAATVIRSGADLEAAQTVLGHSKPATTLIYAERDLARAKDLMRRIG